MKISVCITVYNEEKGMSMIIKSLLNQTRKPDEILIIVRNIDIETQKYLSNFDKSINLKQIIQK